MGWAALFCAGSSTGRSWCRRSLPEKNSVGPPSHPHWNHTGSGLGAQLAAPLPLAPVITPANQQPGCGCPPADRPGWGLEWAEGTRVLTENPFIYTHVLQSNKTLVSAGPLASPRGSGSRSFPLLPASPVPAAQSRLGA